MSVEKFKSNFPTTYRQNKVTLDGKIENFRSNKSKRVQLSSQLAARIVLIPFDIPIRTLVNASVIPFNFGKAIASTAALAHNINPKKKERAKKDLLKLADRSLATITSPFQAPAKAARLFLGVLHPPLAFHKSKLEGAVRELNSKLTKETLSSEWRNKLLDERGQVDLDKYVSLVLLSGLIRHAGIWDLTLDQGEAGLRRLEEYENFLEDSEYWLKSTLKTIKSTPEDSIEQKKQLISKFHALIEEWKEDPNKISLESVKDFIGLNFTSERQKIVLKKIFENKQPMSLDRGSNLDELYVDEKGRSWITKKIVFTESFLVHSAHNRNLEGLKEDAFKKKMEEALLAISEELWQE